MLAQDATGPFLWNGGRRVDLEVPEGTVSQPTAINNAGQAVGVSYSDPNGFEDYHVTLWESGVARDLGQGWAGDINEQGWIVGNRLVDGKVHAALWRNGRTIDLGTLPGTTSSFAYAVNDRGQVTGTSCAVWSCGSSEKRAFLWEDGAMKELASLGSDRPHSVAISERGQVVLTTKARHSPAHVFLWKGDTLTALGTLPGVRSIYAVGINDRNQVLGNTRDPDSRHGPPAHAVVWTLRG